MWAPGIFLVALNSIKQFIREAKQFFLKAKHESAFVTTLNRKLFLTYFHVASENETFRKTKSNELWQQRIRFQSTTSADFDWSHWATEIGIKSLASYYQIKPLKWFTSLIAQQSVITMPFGWVEIEPMRYNVKREPMKWNLPTKLKVIAVKNSRDFRKTKSSHRSGNVAKKVSSGDSSDDSRREQDRLTSLSFIDYLMIDLSAVVTDWVFCLGLCRQ